MSTQTTCNTAVGIFHSHAQAEQAVQELKRGNFDIKNLSIVSRDYHTDEQLVGFYNTGERMMYWGKQGAPKQSGLCATRANQGNSAPAHPPPLPAERYRYLQRTPPREMAYA